VSDGKGIEVSLTFFIDWQILRIIYNVLWKNHSILVEFPKAKYLPSLRQFDVSKLQRAKHS
jgi:hypothetical protein